MHGSRYDRVSQRFNNSSCDTVVGNTNTNRFFSIRKDLRNRFAGFQDKRVRSRKRIAHEFVDGITQLFAVFGQVTEVVTNQRKISFLQFDLFDHRQPFERLVIEHVASHAINRVCRINNDSTFTQAIHYLRNLAWVRVGSVDGEKHESGEWRVAKGEGRVAKGAPRLRLGIGLARKE